MYLDLKKLRIENNGENKYGLRKHRRIKNLKTDFKNKAIVKFDAI